MNEMTPQEILISLRNREARLSNLLPGVEDAVKFAKTFRQLEKVRAQIDKLQLSIHPEGSSPMIGQETLAMSAGPEPARSRKV